MTLTATDAAIIIDTQTSTHDWCVYEHHAVLTEGAPPTVIMVGACKLTEVFNLTDGKVNSEWHRIFGNGGKIMVRLVATSSDKNECFHHASQLMRQHNPICNLKGHNLKNARHSIRCVNNGRLYNSQSEAARDLGIDQGSLSKHMRGQVRTVAGFVFEYATPGDQT